MKQEVLFLGGPADQRFFYIDERTQTVITKELRGSQIINHKYARVGPDLAVYTGIEDEDGEET